MRILIVDDYPEAAEASSMLLRMLGHECRYETRGLDALQALDTFDPDMLLLDIGLPDISGYEIAREVRARAGRRIFIAALTGWGAPEDRAKALAAGVDMHVIKPASAAKLSEILAAANATSVNARV